jgi:hypothetical protein
MGASYNLLHRRPARKLLVNDALLAPVTFTVYISGKLLMDGDGLIKCIRLASRKLLTANRCNWIRVSLSEDRAAEVDTDIL